MLLVVLVVHLDSYIRCFVEYSGPDLLSFPDTKNKSLAHLSCLSLTMWDGVVTSYSNG